jgi:hypothetical protein
MALEVPVYMSMCFLKAFDHSYLLTLKQPDIHQELFVWHTELLSTICLVESTVGVRMWGYVLEVSYQTEKWHGRLME